MDRLRIVLISWREWNRGSGRRRKGRQRPKGLRKRLERKITKLNKRRIKPRLRSSHRLQQKNLKKHRKRRPKLNDPSIFL